MTRRPVKVKPNYRAPPNNHSIINIITSLSKVAYKSQHNSSILVAPANLKLFIVIQQVLEYSRVLQIRYTYDASNYIVYCSIVDPLFKRNYLFTILPTLS